MSKIKVIQQVLDPSGSGGVSAEYRALQRSKLLEDYEFIPMVLMRPHNGVNLKDIVFYYRFLKRHPGDIVHIRGAAPDGLNAVIAAKLAGKGKILVSIHGMYSDLVYISPLKRWVSYHIIEKLTFALADGISCVCRAAQERDRFRRYRRKMLPYVYNRIPDYSGFDQSALRQQIRGDLGIAAEAQVGLYVGRVTKEKGLTELSAALKDLPDNCRFLVVGDGAYLEEMKAAAKDNVLFLGEQKDVYRFLFASDFFVLPSLHENHSIALLEAAAAGLPIIATDVGGNGEIVREGENGILIPRGNEAALRQAICCLCDAPDNCARLAAASARMGYEMFRDDSVDRCLYSAYQKILGRTSENGCTD